MAQVTEFNKKKDAPAPLEVKKENVVFFEVETNDAYNYNDLTPEEKAELAKKNQQFEANVIQRLLLDRAAPCQCQTPRIMQRLETKMRLGLLQAGSNGQVPVELLQEDVDTHQFGIVVESTNGVYSGVNMIISKCKGCGDIHLHGDIEAITRLFAGAFAQEVEIAAHRASAGVEEAIAQSMERSDGIPADPDGPAYILENTETGERTDASDVGAALFGKEGSGEIRTEPVETAAPEEK